jgi:hypothetical protein
MKKIPTVFKRNYDTDYLVRDEVVSGCEWVLAGEGRATRKWDGTCVLMENGELFRRFELKPGKDAPAGFRPAQQPDSVTEALPGWVPVGEGPEDRWNRQALLRYREKFGNMPPDGTYELVGPHVNGNPEGFEEDTFVPHGNETLEGFPRTFDEMKAWFTTYPYGEGVVFWHPDGRKAKIKLRDFGIKRMKVVMA